jgi:hypothetical protein
MEEQQILEQETQQTLQNQEIPNRRERRRRLKQQGVLRYLSKLSFFNPVGLNYRAENLKVGNRIQQIRRERLEKEWEEVFMAKLENMKETWYEIGYNAEEIGWLEEAAAIGFANIKETRREDKKEAQQLMKRAKESLAARQ